MTATDFDLASGISCHRWTMPGCRTVLLPSWCWSSGPSRSASSASAGTPRSALGLRRSGGRRGTDAGEALRHGTAWRQPGLAELARLAALDFSDLDAAGRIAALADQHRQAAWWSARQLALVSLISTRDSTDKHWCVEEIGCALGLSGPAAQNLLKNAERLCRQLPATFTALSRGPDRYRRRDRDHRGILRTTRRRAARLRGPGSAARPPTVGVTTETGRQAGRAATGPGLGRTQAPTRRRDRHIRIAPADPAPPG